MTICTFDVTFHLMKNLLLMSLQDNESKKTSLTTYAEEFIILGKRRRALLGLKFLHNILLQKGNTVIDIRLHMVT